MVRKIRIFFSFVAILFALVTGNLWVSAEADGMTGIAKSKEGVLLIRLVYVDPSGKQYILQTGSSFLLGSDEGARTVITNYHTVHLTDENRQYWSNELEVDFYNENQTTLKIQAVVKKDVVIDVSYINGSEKTDFAILELSQAIFDREPLKIADSDRVREAQNVYGLGFSWAASDMRGDSSYTRDDVTIVGGIVGNLQNVDDIPFILHSVRLGQGNSGGPLVDSEGNVIGVNTMFTEGEGEACCYYSIAINEVAEVLEALGIPYERVEDVKMEDVVEEWKMSVNVPRIATGSKNGRKRTFIVKIAAVIAIFTMIMVPVVIVCRARMKKKTADLMRPARNAGCLPAIDLPGNPWADPLLSLDAPPTLAFPPVFAQRSRPTDMRAGETTVLGGAGETSLLGGGDLQPAASLIRRKNGETAKIMKPMFLIGKERRKVDFCISDNHSVSRSHASIICRNGSYYILDNHSTNHTFVNGNKICPDEAVKLHSGDKIRLADEDFDFYL